VYDEVAFQPFFGKGGRTESSKIEGIGGGLRVSTLIAKQETTAIGL
jgi:hypothetical protein